DHPSWPGAPDSGTSNQIVSPRLRRLPFALVVAAMLLAASGSARTGHANGRPPGTTAILFDPENPSRMLLGFTSGLGLSTNAGRTFSWICEQSVGYGTTFDPPLSFAPSGALLAGLDTASMTRSDDAGCTW